MTLTTREKKIATGAGLAGVLVIFYFVGMPFITHGQEIQTQREAVRKNLDNAKNIIDMRNTLRGPWKRMKDSEGLTSDVPDALNQIEEALQRWATASGVVLTNISPSQGILTSNQRSDKPETKFQRLEVSVTGIGSMSQLTHLMWRLEAAPKLLKVLDMKIVPVKEGIDNLQFTVKVGTISLAAEAPRPAPAATPVPDASGAGAQP